MAETDNTEQPTGKITEKEATGIANKLVESNIRSFLQNQGYNILDSIRADVDKLNQGAPKKDIKVQVQLVKDLKARFPELRYVINMFASMAVFSAYTGKIFDKNLNIDVYYPNKGVTPKKKTTVENSMIQLFKENNIEFQLYQAIQDLLYFGWFILYEEDDGIITMISPESDYLEIKDEKTFIYRGKKLAKTRYHFITNNKDKHLGESVVLSCWHYLKIIQNIELSMLIERLTKASTYNVWKIGVDGIDDDDIGTYVAIFKNNVLAKIKPVEDSEEPGGDNAIINIDLVKHIANSHIFVPQSETAKVEIESVEQKFKPMLEDIEYFYNKVYLALGIPLHLRESASTVQGVATEAILFHNTVFATNVRYYQKIMETVMESVVIKYLEENKIKFDFVNVRLPEVRMDHGQREHDLDKLTKGATAFMELSNALGLKIKTEFVLDVLFPGVPIDQIIDLAKSPATVDGSKLEDGKIKENVWESSVLVQPSSQINKQTISYHY